MSVDMSRYGFAILVIVFTVNFSDYTNAFQSVNLHRCRSITPSKRVQWKRNVVTDPKTLLGEEAINASRANTGKRKRSNAENFDLILSSRIPKQLVGGYEINSSVVEIKGREQTSRIWSNGVKQVSPLSSTMPGFRDRRKNKFTESIYSPGTTMPGFRDEQRKSKQSPSNSDCKETKRKSQLKMYKSYSSVPDSLIDFTAEIHKVDRVTPQEEVELGMKSQEATHLQSIYDTLEIRLGRQPTSDEWCAAAGKLNMEALREAIQEGIHAKNKLVTANLRLVQRVVNVYLRNGLGSRYNAGDLMQEGNIALIRAAEKFEPSKGYRFSTYAMYWIRSSIKRSQLMQSREIVMPQRQHETHKKAKLISDRIEMETGMRPSMKVVAEEMGITKEKLTSCIKYMNQDVCSLDQDVRNRKGKNSLESGVRLTELVESKFDESDYFDAQRTLVRDDLIGVIRNSLDDLDADIIMLRFGLIDERLVPAGASGPMSISEVSTAVGLKPDKVRRIINNSLTKLRPILKDVWIGI